MLPALIIILIIILLIILYFITTYNKLVKLRNRVKDGWAQIDVQLKRRFDLIPNIVETVKGYAGHEKETLDAVITARNKAVSATTPEEEMKANGELNAKYPGGIEAQKEMLEKEGHTVIQKGRKIFDITLKIMKMRCIRFKEIGRIQ